MLLIAVQADSSNSKTSSETGPSLTAIWAVKGVTYAILAVAIGLYVYVYFWPWRSAADDVISVASEKSSNHSLVSHQPKYGDFQTVLQTL
jgi:anti-sigma-K factor RskA